MEITLERNVQKTNENFNVYFKTDQKKLRKWKIL